MFAIPEQNKIYVTGASGWVGRTIMHELQKIMPASEFTERVVAFGSKPKKLLSSYYKKEEEVEINIKPLSDIGNKMTTDKVLLIHAAFLTKDRMKEYGRKKFIETNQQITRTVVDFLKKTDNTKVVHMSSGAATSSEGKRILPTIDERDPYGLLKLVEEQEISKVAKTQIFRIYALTGKFIRTPEEFAIGSMIMQAQKNEPIVVKSPYPVIRSYVSASDLAKCSIAWLLSNDKPIGPIGASTCITTLESLAKTIAEQYYQPNPIINKMTGVANSYSCSPVDFENMLRRYEIRSKTMIEQIADTGSGLRHNTQYEIQTKKQGSK